MLALLPYLSSLATALPLPPPQEGLRTRRTREAIVKANTDARIARAVGQRIDNFCAVFDDFYDELGLEKKSDNKLVARVFDTYEEYESVFRRQHPDEAPPLAFFSSSMNAIVLFNDERDVTLRQTLFHEASHQYLNRYTSEVPRWLNEGLAEYFEGWRMSPEGKFQEKRPNIYDLTVLQEALRSGNDIGLEELVSWTDLEFHEFRRRKPTLHPYLHYATSWGVAWFSLEAGTQEDLERVVDYIDDLMTKGTSARFEVERWSALEERWRASILALSAEPVDALDHVLLASGHRDNGAYAEAIDHYQTALGKDEDVPGLHYWLGYCYKRLRRYQLALQWLEDARLRNPEDASAWYQAAQTLLWMGKPAEALPLAEQASDLQGDESPRYLALVALCQKESGDKRRALRTARRILKLVEDDEEKAVYERFLEEEIEKDD